ncbi:MAG TPA: hypothetical protein VEJ18_17950, partial [Planctomycetota bacterium]|nr:hypothetical protein [Planctomycetota bacterium]
MALVLVLTVILALTLIATPFVLSMVLQERSGTMARYASQADWAADGAKNYALWRLMQSVDPIERGARGNGNTYYFDAPTELEVRLDDPALAQKLKIADPKGSIWGLTVQDEQAKINVKSAPETLVGRVLGGIDPAVVSPKEFLTLYSGRDATWVVPQRIRPAGFEAGSTGAAGAGVTCDSLHVLAPRSRVKITKPGLPPFYARIAGNTLVTGRAQNQPHTFTTTPGLPSQYLDGMIEVEYRHPVNINTARPETLAALFTGLEYPGDPPSRIDAATANSLAMKLAGRSFPRLEEFLRTLSQQGLNPKQFEVVAINAVCPSYAPLGSSGTMPFCFKTYDVYSIEAAGSMNNPAGAQVAGRGYREVVSVSPPNPLRQPVESQYDFDRMLASLAAAVQRADLLGFPYGNRMHTFPNLLPSVFPSEPPSRPNGPSDIALKSQQRAPDDAAVAMTPARDFRGVSSPPYENALAAGPPVWRPGVPREHFDNDHEGHKLRGSAYVLSWKRVFTSDPPGQTGAGQGRRPDVTTGGYEMWIRFDGAPSGPTTLFDIREGDWMNRLTLRLENNELIFEACDGTMGDPNWPIDNGAAEVRQPFQPEADTWYHLGLYWKGTRFGQLALLV